MAQYQVGTVDITNGSTTVVGHGTEWLTYADIGYSFKIDRENVLYQIAIINSDTNITLVSNYAGATRTGKNYQITVDYTPNYELEEWWAGDRDIEYHITNGTIREIDTLLKRAIEKPTVEYKTDSYSVVLSTDMGKVILMDSTANKTFTLPSVDEDDIGVMVSLGKLGAGSVTITTSDSDKINGTTSASYYCSSNGVAWIDLCLVTTTIWIGHSRYNTWTAL